MTITKTYSQDIFGKQKRKKEEKKLFKQGYVVANEEEVREWEASKGCCLAIIFLPLIFFGKEKKIKVTYELHREKKGK